MEGAPAGNHKPVGGLDDLGKSPPPKEGAALKGIVESTVCLRLDVHSMRSLLLLSPLTGCCSRSRLPGVVSRTDDLAAAAEAVQHQHLVRRVSAEDGNADDRGLPDELPVGVGEQRERRTERGAGQRSSGHAECAETRTLEER